MRVNPGFHQNHPVRSLRAVPPRHSPKPEQFQGRPDRFLGPATQQLHGNEMLAACATVYFRTLGKLHALDANPHENEFSLAIPLNHREPVTLKDLPNLHLLIPGIIYRRRIWAHVGLMVLGLTAFFHSWWLGLGLLVGNWILSGVRLLPYFFARTLYRHSPGFKMGNAFDTSYGAAFLQERLQLLEQMLDDRKPLVGNPHPTEVYKLIGEGRALIEQTKAEVEAKVRVTVHAVGVGGIIVVHTSKTALFLPEGNATLHELRSKMCPIFATSEGWIGKLPVRYLAKSIDRDFQPVPF